MLLLVCLQEPALLFFRFLFRARNRVTSTFAISISLSARLSSFDRSGHKKYCSQPPMQHCKVVPDSGIKEIFACGIRIPGLRNQNSDLGIRNPTNNWNPKSKFHWQGPRSSMQSRIQLRLSWITLPRGPAPVLMTYSHVNRSPFDCVSNRNPKSQFKCVCFTIQLSLPNERDKDTKYFSMFLLIERMVYL